MCHIANSQEGGGESKIESIGWMTKFIKLQHHRCLYNLVVKMTVYIIIMDNASSAAAVVLGI